MTTGLAAVPGALAACSSSTSGPSSSPSSSMSAPAGPASASAGSISFGSNYSDPAPKQAFAALVSGRADVDRRPDRN